VCDQQYPNPVLAQEQGTNRVGEWSKKFPIAGTHKFRSMLDRMSIKLYSKLVAF